jgi:hypothetical protein
MLRREFIAGAATFALSAQPVRLRAQQTAPRRTRIGILIYGAPSGIRAHRHFSKAFVSLAISRAKTSFSNTGLLTVGRNGFLDSPRIWFRASPT